MIAARWADEDTVRWLLDHGADARAMTLVRPILGTTCDGEARYLPGTMRTELRCDQGTLTSGAVRGAAWSIDRARTALRLECMKPRRLAPQL